MLLLTAIRKIRLSFGTGRGYLQKYDRSGRGNHHPGCQGEALASYPTSAALTSSVEISSRQHVFFATTKSGPKRGRPLVCKTTLLVVAAEDAVSGVQKLLKNDKYFYTLEAEVPDEQTI